MNKECSISVTVNIKGECEMQKNVSITINITSNVPDLVVDTSQVPTSGQVGTPYSGQLQVSGGVAPYTFELASGTLPDGVSLMSDGSFSGTPTAAGAFTFEVAVKDSSN